MTLKIDDAVLKFISGWIVPFTRACATKTGSQPREAGIDAQHGSIPLAGVPDAEYQKHGVLEPDRAQMEACSQETEGQAV